MLLWDGRDDESRMKVDQRCAKGAELGISASHLEVLVRLLAGNAYGVTIYQNQMRTPVLMVYTIKLPPVSLFFPASVMRIGNSGFSYRICSILLSYIPFLRW